MNVNEDQYKTAESFWHKKYLQENRKLLTVLNAFLILIDAAKERDLDSFKQKCEQVELKLREAMNETPDV